MWTVRSNGATSAARKGAGHDVAALTANVGGDAAGADLLVRQDLGVGESPVAVTRRLFVASGALGESSHGCHVGAHVALGRRADGVLVVAPGEVGRRDVKGALGRVCNRAQGHRLQQTQHKEKWA